MVLFKLQGAARELTAKYERPCRGCRARCVSPGEPPSGPLAPAHLPTCIVPEDTLSYNKRAVLLNYLDDVSIGVEYPSARHPLFRGRRGLSHKRQLIFA